jgi:hypothetical protein
VPCDPRIARRAIIAYTDRDMLLSARTTTTTTTACGSVVVRAG